MIEILPEILLSVFMIAFVLMGVACYCTIIVFQIATKSLLVVYQNDRSMYKKILGKRELSWIERRTNSIKDFGLWINLYQMLYRGGEIEKVIGQKVKARFSRYATVMLFSYISAIILAGSVVFIGFSLAS